MKLGQLKLHLYYFYQITATNCIQDQWFTTAAGKNSAANAVEDFISQLSEFSFALLRKVINMADESVSIYSVFRGKLGLKNQHFEV